ncbi:hypothetical protein [Tunturibacter empetritectus]|uniref:Cyclic nucleotide-binding domain-containing protein n=2 Tax=Tunturiibacter empetritectus TaxID=3069691 RepID=A0A7W8IKP6_9BACT|nr:hypothetical protein [Edaphobacter lichenicola]MBB5318954.1 hypothetical protein [Edaphobacter lichenicola]
MMVPKSLISTFRRRLPLMGVLLFSLALPLFAARGPEPLLRLPLEPFGFQPLSEQFLLAGSSMLTIHYVDNQHLLLTFSARHLLKRLPDEPEDDMDRTIDAVLLELPSGHVLARTTWRTHDHGQYLWSLGHGHFLLRIRDTLTTFAPLANLATGQPFAEHPFLSTDDRRIAVVILSPDADLLTVETVKRTPPARKPKTPLFGPTSVEPAPEPKVVQINFYRLHVPTEPGTQVKASPAGAVRSRGAGGLPVSVAGYLSTVDQGHQHYAFDFHSYAGKVDELSPFDSTCPPFPLFVSHSEFIVFGCRTGQTIGAVGGFNMRGQEMWEQGLFGDFIAPSLVYAPSSGRFALSRVLLHSSAVADQPISADEISAQTVVVYQTDSGKQVFHADCTPVERAGQNFALAPDGLSLALIHADAIEIYRLPPLTPKEENAVKLAQTSAPPENDLPVHFVSQLSPSTEEADSTVQPEAQPANAVAPTTANTTAPDLTQTPPPANAVPATEPSGDAAQATGDPVPEEHRKPPTLYTLPTDKPSDRPSSSDRPKDTPQ